LPSEGFIGLVEYSSLKPRFSMSDSTASLKRHRATSTGKHDAEG
jgi:hypothetical protein